MKLDAQTFCDVIWRGKERRFALAAPYNLLCFWESCTSPPEHLFVVLEELYDLCGESDYKPITLDDLRRRFLFKWDCGERGQRAWARVVSFDDKTDVLLHPSGRGEIRVLCSEPEDYSYLESPPRAFQLNEFRVPFLFEEGMAVLEWSLNQWQKQLHHWKTLPHHDFAFALAWLKKSPEEKQAYLYRFPQGNQEEMERVLEWIACLEGNKLFLESHKSHQFQNEVSVCLIFCEGKRMLCQRNSILSQPQLHVSGSHFAALWQTWFAFFALSLKLDILEQHISAYQDMESADQDFFIVPQSSTAHEYAETCLQLRDWLRERVGLDDEQIKQLLT